jgi:hypothetical protein
MACDAILIEIVVELAEPVTGGLDHVYMRHDP